MPISAYTCRQLSSTHSFHALSIRVDHEDQYADIFSSRLRYYLPLMYISYSYPALTLTNLRWLWADVGLRLFRMAITISVSQYTDEIYVPEDEWVNRY